MKPREISNDELLDLRTSGKEFCLYYDWEECVIRLGVAPKGDLLNSKGRRNSSLTQIVMYSLKLF